MAKSKLENEPGEGMQHEKAEGPVMEKQEDAMEMGDMEMGDMEKDSNWEAECDSHDLLRAAEVKADPARYKAALAVLQKKKAAIESIDDLKAARNESFKKA